MKRGGSTGGQVAGLVLLIVLVSTTVTFMVLVSHRLSDSSDWHIGRLAGPSSQAAAATPVAMPADTPAAAPAPDSLAKYLLEHEDPECAELIKQTSKIMFIMIGGRGYHDVRARTGLRSWARCVCHVMVLTDPSVDIAEYISPHRFVYIVSGDAWRKRPYLPMTHMDSLGKTLTRPQSPAADVQWFFLVSDRSFVHVPRLLARVATLPTDSKGYYGQVASAAMKESFGFHEYVDLNTGVLLSSTLFTKVVDPANCHDQKTAGGTFDMFDAKLVSRTLTLTLALT